MANRWCKCNTRKGKVMSDSHRKDQWKQRTSSELGQHFVWPNIHNGCRRCAAYAAPKQPNIAVMQQHCLLYIQINFISECSACHRAVKLLTPMLKSNTRSSAVTDEIHSMYSIVTRGHVNGEVRGYLIAGMAAITDWSTNITMYLHWQ